LKNNSHFNKNKTLQQNKTSSTILNLLQPLFPKQTFSTYFSHLPHPIYQLPPKETDPKL